VTQFVGRESQTRPDEHVTRSPADVLRFAVGVVVLLVVLAIERLFGDTLVGFASDLLRGLDAIPAWMRDLVVVAARVLAVVVLGGGLVWLIVHARWRMLTTVATPGWSLRWWSACSPAGWRRADGRRRWRSRSTCGR